jgi:hypothetical protein
VRSLLVEHVREPDPMSMSRVTYRDFATVSDEQRLQAFHVFTIKERFTTWRCEELFTAGCPTTCNRAARFRRIPFSTRPRAALPRQLLAVLIIGSLRCLDRHARGVSISGEAPNATQRDRAGGTVAYVPWVIHNNHHHHASNQTSGQDQCGLGRGLRQLQVRPRR